MQDVAAPSDLGHEVSNAGVSTVENDNRCTILGRRLNRKPVHWSFFSYSAAVEDQQLSRRPIPQMGYAVSFFVIVPGEKSVQEEA